MYVEFFVLIMLSIKRFLIKLFRERENCAIYHSSDILAGRLISALESKNSSVAAWVIIFDG